MFLFWRKFRECWAKSVQEKLVPRRIDPRLLWILGFVIATSLLWQVDLVQLAAAGVHRTALSAGTRQEHRSRQGSGSRLSGAGAEEVGALRQEVRVRQELYGVDGRQEAVLRNRAETTEGKTESGESAMNDMIQAERCMHTVFRLFFISAHGWSYTSTKHRQERTNSSRYCSGSDLSACYKSSRSTYCCW